MSNETTHAPGYAPESTSVRVVGVDAETVSALVGSGFRVVDDRDSPVDCLVVDVDAVVSPDEDRPVWERAGAPPAVLVAPSMATIEDHTAFEGYARTGDGDGLCDQILWVVSKRRGRDRPPGHDWPDDGRLETLHRGTVRLIEAENATDLFEQAVDIASHLLEFNSCYIAVDEDGWLVKQAGVGDVTEEPLSVDHGVVGKSYRTKTTQLVGDTSTDPDAVPVRPTHRSGIAVPLGDDGIFVVIADEPDAFTERDRELAELLASYVTATRERLRVAEELRDQRDRFSALFENIPAPAVSYEVVDGTSCVRAVNPAFERVFGYPAEEIVGQNLDAYVIPDDEADDGDVGLNAHLQRGESVRIECRRQTRDGIRTFILKVVPLELGTENVAGFAIYTDITDRQKRERELRRQNERLDEFANIVSHDLRNPLSVASGYLELAERGDDEALERVGAALERMNQLVEDLLELAREGQVVGETEPLDVAAVARRAWAGVDVKGATIELPETLPAEADERRLLNLFENLFRNAVEHGSTTPHSHAREDSVEHAPKTVTVRVEPLGTENGDGIEGFAVEDDGTGIPETMRETVFESGQTTSNEGTGYGLAIVNRIAEAHGWSVSVTDSEMGGARFEIRFDGVP